MYLDQQRKAYSRVKNHFIRELLGDPEGKRFLDYGCGAGFFVVDADKRGAARVIGVDAEPAVLATAAYFTAREGVADRCEFLVSGHFPAWDPPPGFDAILMKDVIEHVADDQDLLNRARENLAPGGVLVVSTQHALSLNYLIQGVYHRHWRGEKGWFGWDETHLRFYTFFGLAGKLRRAGLRPLAWRANYLIPHKFPRRSVSGGTFLRVESLSRLDLWLGRYFPWNRLGWNLIVKAGKKS